jgi:intracellular multiplication protein IcmE
VHKAGDIIFAVVETSVNSDQPGPVLAKIVSGPLAGSKVLGSFQRQEKMLFLEFSVLSVPDIPSSISMNAVAVDPETARTAVRTGVNNRYLIRYGTLIASAFLEGMGDAILTSLGTPNLTDDSGTIIASQVTATGRDQLIVGLGKVGQRIGQEIDQSDIPPLVTLDSGTGVGLLFLKDLRIEEPEEAPSVKKSGGGAAESAPAQSGQSGSMPVTLNLNFDGGGQASAGDNQVATSR